jgi:formamidopyrimidine-DNA glycosylase
MPELPDVTVYRESLEARIVGQVLRAVDLPSPFVLRTALPPIASAIGREVVAIRRIGKRLVLALDGDLFVVLHLMIAGRLLWRPAGAAATSAPAANPAAAAAAAVTAQRTPAPAATALEPKAAKPTAAGGRPSRRAAKPLRNVIARFQFDNGLLAFTEAGTKKRASIHVVAGEAALAAVDPGGIEPLEADLAAFRARLVTENHTLKRALTDPRLFSGIGNAYSDEILHRARLSPFALTTRLDAEAVERLWLAVRATLEQWAERLRTEARATPHGFPETVTAFHPQMAVHGRFGKPCPVCAAPIQRVVYADNETNYCARCQTNGVVLADRSLSRLLKASWPRSIDELG